MGRKQIATLVKVTFALLLLSCLALVLEFSRQNANDGPNAMTAVAAGMTAVVFLGGMALAFIPRNRSQN